MLRIVKSIVRQSIMRLIQANSLRTDIVFGMEVGMHFGRDSSPIQIMRLEPRPHLRSGTRLENGGRELR